MKIRKERRERMKMKRKRGRREEKHFLETVLHSNPYVEYILMSNEKCFNNIMKSKYVIC